MMGYELFVPEVRLTRKRDAVEVGVEVENRGVAPCYYDWVVVVAAVDAQKIVVARMATPWRLREVLPDKSVRMADGTAGRRFRPRPGTFVMRVVNPLANGKPLCFANVEQDATLAGWLTLGDVPVR